MRNVGVQRVEGFVYPASTHWINPPDLPLRDSLGLIYLYKITNLINKKNCIGQTNNLRQRFYQYRSSANRGLTDQVIQRAILKYGFDNFSFEQIATCQNRQDADYLETLLIQQYGSHVSLENGYNVDWGGQGENAIRSEETCRKISESLQKHYEIFDSHLKDKPLAKEHTLASGKERLNRRRFSIEVEMEICHLYTNNHSMKSLSRQFKCYSSLIRDILRRNGIIAYSSRESKCSNRHNIFTLEQEIEICSLIKNGEAINRAELARKIGCNKSTLRNILLRNGVKL